MVNRKYGVNMVLQYTSSIQGVSFILGSTVDGPECLVETRNTGVRYYESVRSLREELEAMEAWTI